MDDKKKDSPDSDSLDGDSKEATTSPAEEKKAEVGQQSPSDALSRTPEDLEQEQADQIEEANDFSDIDKDEAKRKTSRVRQFLRKLNLYFLMFLLLVVIAGAIAVVNYLNNKNATPEINLATQELTEDALQQLVNRDTSVGSSSQTLTIQGNAVISGQTLTRGNLNVAGSIQSGEGLQGPSLTISGNSNLGQAQINELQVANGVAIEGDTTMRNLNVSGSSSFGGDMIASQITVSRLILSGNASLQVPNHISFPGASPSRTIGNGLGVGGSASVDGSDTAGTVNINTGNSPQAGCFVRINFNQQFANQPHVIISPVGAAAGRTQYYVERNQSGFSICAASPAPANQAFAFDYFVTN